MDSPRIRRALVSVSNKMGLLDFARGLASAGVELYGTGGTRTFLQDEGLAIHDVAAYTGFPEMLDGRLKTLHPRVFGGILARRDRQDDMQALAEHGILAFDLVVVNLYPFEATVARGDVTLAEAIEQIDIGGPSLIRAAAKNQAFVTVATDPEQYAPILEAVTATGATSPELRRRLAQAAFMRTAAYDRAIAAYLEKPSEPDAFAPTVSLTARRKTALRYGENPHQKAALYVDESARSPSLVSAQQLAGKELSYNNLLDLDSALAIARSFESPAVAVLKHNNPCGAAVADRLADAARQALDGDPESAFGSVLGMNRAVDAATAEALSAPGLFIEAIVAPDFEHAALEILTTRPKWKSSVRLMKVGQLAPPTPSIEWRQIAGGWLAQDADTEADFEREWQVVTTARPDQRLMPPLRFAWRIVRRVKSNAIVLATGGPAGGCALCGVGAGQMSRVDSVRIAVHKADARGKGAVLASDAFFPFPDSIEIAAQAGVAAIIQPGGSRKDDEVIAACNRHGLPMIFTGRRHFKH